MPANTEPIFGITPNVGWAPAILTANTTMTGVGTVSVIFTAGANGSFFRKVLARPIGTNIQTVMRVFLNNGLDLTVAANNTLIGEVTIPATTASNTVPLFPAELMVNMPIPAGARITVTIGTTVATGIAPSGWGSDY